MTSIKQYYSLTKPGIIYSNTLTALAGYLLASKFNIDWQDLLSLIFGVAFIIASACVINNVIDHNIDSKMSRTKSRALVTNEISLNSAKFFSLMLGLFGFLILAFTNQLTFIIGVIAYVSYVVLYGIAKRKTVHGTLVGAIPGSASLVAGYTASTGSLDITALVLFLIMVSWQMAHFYAISINRLSDYKNAKLPVRSVKYGVENTKKHIVFYICLFILLCITLSMVGPTGYLFALVMAAAGGYWLHLALKVSPLTDSKAWAKKVFMFSLIVILVLCLSLSVGAVLA